MPRSTTPNGIASHQRVPVTGCISTAPRITANHSSATIPSPADHHDRAARPTMIAASGNATNATTLATRCTVPPVLGPTAQLFFGNATITNRHALQTATRNDGTDTTRTTPRTTNAPTPASDPIASAVTPRSNTHASDSSAYSLNVRVTGFTNDDGGTTCSTA